MLRNGEVLLAPEKQTVITSGSIRVHVKPGAIAVVKREENGCVRVRGLWESSSNGIVAHGGPAGEVSVRAGQEVVLAPSEAEMTKFLKQDTVARRRVLRYKNATGEAVMVSEVSFLSTINDCTVLSSLLKSRNPDDKSLTGKIVKMAVALSVVTSKHGNYMPIKPPN